MGFAVTLARPSVANASGGGQSEQPLTAFGYPVLADEAGNAVAASQKYGALAVALVDANTGLAYTAGGSGTTVESGSTGGAAANNVTLPGAAGKTTYIDGFAITGLGATAGSTIAVTITGLTTTLTFYLTIPAGATTAITPLIVSFGSNGIAASAVNTAIVVNVPSFGAGNTTASVAAWGHQQ